MAALQAVTAVALLKIGEHGFGSAVAIKRRATAMLGISLKKRFAGGLASHKFAAGGIKPLGMIVNGGGAPHAALPFQRPKSARSGGS